LEIPKLALTLPLVFSTALYRVPSSCLSMQSLFEAISEALFSALTAQPIQVHFNLPYVLAMHFLFLVSWFTWSVFPFLS